MHLLLGTIDQQCWMFLAVICMHATDRLGLDAAARAADAGTSEDDGGGGHRAREARLVKMVDNLKRRLEQCRAENAQLEEMLRHADARACGMPAPMPDAFRARPTGPGKLPTLLVGADTCKNKWIGMTKE
jgi:hypothetical protein